ncbi:unnamed protein product [Leptidea sinapis]|uniref:Uncharacterized protein n=1 Tax=Leptidea sinapis TaxID=189913 RepID=A0A5E4Q4P4_9NEOP|nr:unnamed protein product [Leptidea sinapis]
MEISSFIVYSISFFLLNIKKKIMIMLCLLVLGLIATGYVYNTSLYRFIYHSIVDIAFITSDRNFSKAGNGGCCA